MNETKDIRLTQYSHGAGCGCKIAPRVLQEMVKHVKTTNAFSQLLVGNAESDDAAVYEWMPGHCIISTADFFMPIVDDPYDFGRVASVNAISDVYAMGGVPMMAIALLGWPIKTLDAATAGRVLEGAKFICDSIGIPLAGGHSIDSPEPIFGLSVTGSVKTSNIKKNSGGKPGDLLYLTKPLGVGILTTAIKKGILDSKWAGVAIEVMTKLNTFGAICGKMDYIHAMTDVTGFGLGGHLLEMCQGSQCKAVLQMGQIPIVAESILIDLIQKGSIPGGTIRNFDSYGAHIQPMLEEQKSIICDPQTSGGLLIAVKQEEKDTFDALIQDHHIGGAWIGQLISSSASPYTISFESQVL